MVLVELPTEPTRSCNEAPVPQRVTDMATSEVVLSVEPEPPTELTRGGEPAASDMLRGREATHTLAADTRLATTVLSPVEDR